MRVGDIVRPCPSLHINDSVGKAAETLRQSGVAVLPVVADGQVVGVVDEERLFAISLNSHHHRQVIDLMMPVPAVLMTEMPIEQAAWVMQRYGARALPVVDGAGQLKGVVTRSDVASALLRGLRPLRIGGMATPFGVYLTTGNHRGGVGDFALMTTGVVMALCLAAARAITALALYAIDALQGTRLFSAYLSGIGTMPPAPWGGSWLDLLPWLEMLLFFALMRMLPLTGFHGAEHQVVHAIERGEDLLPEAVSRMPLEHPRCGTNLAALVLLLTTIAVSRAPAPLMIVLVIATLLFWRQAGMLLQRLFTVKRPTPKQLLNGIRAGRQLLERFQHQPSRFVPLPMQVWNMGFLQVLIGAWLTLGVLREVAKALGFPPLPL
jgi:CBS domain-containing protein